MSKKFAEHSQLNLSQVNKDVLKKWGIEGEWIGVGHCILGYPAGDPQPAAPRKSDYILKV